MLKITDQYFWNFVLLVFFLALVVMAGIILQTESRLPLAELAWLDLVLVGLAAWRATRLVAEDTTTKFFREQFYDLKKTTRSFTLVRPNSGPRRTIIDIITNPWNLGLGMSLLITFVYLLTEYAVLPVLILALSGVLSLIQLGTNRLAQKSTEE